MRLVFEISDQDVAQARSFFAEHESNAFVRRRRGRNVEGRHEPVTKDLFWRAFATGLLTTQQRSGPGKPVNQFVSADPFPLALGACRKDDTEAFVLSRVQEHGGIRRGPTIARDAAKSLAWLESEGWGSTMEQVRLLEEAPDDEAARFRLERCAAQYLDAKLMGVGPKQARNILQILGLTRFVVPLDSRVGKWLRRFGFPLDPSGSALADASYYELVEDGFCVLCRRAGVLPCLMDAAIFASFDPPDAWERDPPRR